MATGKRTRVLASLVVLAVAIGLLTSLAGRTVALAAMLENWLIDLRVAATADTVPPDKLIAIVAITEATLATLAYRHPIDRALLAGIVRKANAAKARAVAFDILFDQATEPTKDADFQNAVKASAIPVHIGFADRDDGLTESQSAYLSAFAPGARRNYVNLVRDDRDGTVRSTLSGRGQAGDFRLGLAMALSGLADVPQRNLIRLRRGESENGSPFPIYPAQVFHLLPNNWIKGRILMVGAVLPHEDRFATSFVALDGLERGTRPGVEIHAHALADLLARRPLSRSSFPMDAVVAMLLALVGVAVGAMSGRIVVKTCGVLLVLGLFWWAGTVAVSFADIVVPLFMPTMALVLASGAGAALAGRRHRAEKRFIREAMSRYVAPAVVEDLQRHPEKLRLGGERRDLTLIFTDIAGFTTTSEATAPEVLVPILNDYLDGMSRIVMQHGGTIDKFIGDALVAIFGAPLIQDDHAARAVACMRELDRFATRFVARGPAKEIALGMTRITEALESADAALARFHLDRLDAGETGTTIILEGK